MSEADAERRPDGSEETAASLHGPGSSIDPEEIERFSAIAAEWWDPNGKFRPLHKFNPVRLAYLRDQICAHFGRDPHARKPFEGLRLLDIGCGGGLLCEPMARLGATVVGADAAEKNIKTASVHANEQGLEIDYRTTTAEDLVASGETFDVVLNMEVVEHVADPRCFMADCAKLVDPRGIMFVATLNRTMKAGLLAIFGAEYVLGWLPRGTHTWGKFITPDEMRTFVEAGNLAIKDLSGVSYAPLADSWRLSRDTDVNYMLVATPNPAQ